jgi:Rnl2 family RNA ligase
MFKKYSSIENHYRQKYILNCLSQFPELQDCKYSIREKVDGANVQFLFKKGQKMRVGKRSSFLNDGDSFFNIWTAIEKNQECLNRFQEFADEGDYEIRVYGELYGPNINGRVDYGPKQDLLFFDIELDGQMVSQRKFEEILNLLGLMEKAVPLLGYANNLQDALAVPCDFDSKVLGIENNASEGIVIKPYEKEYTMGNGSRFILKKKSEKFKEKESKGKAPKVEENLPQEVVSLMLNFRGYVNKNRVLSVFSKHGEIQEPKEIGKYIQLVMDDAKEDFLKDHAIPEGLEKKVEKKIFNVGGHVVNLLKEHL